MVVTNHLLAGSIIGATIDRPLLALVIAYSSHFVMDAAPHFGYPGGKSFSEAVSIASKHRLSYIVSCFTLISSAILLAFLAIHRQWFPIIAGFVAASPDFFMFINYALYERHRRKPRGPKLYLYLNLFFHGRIQYERPWGIYIEATCLAIFTTLLFRYI